MFANEVELRSSDAQTPSADVSADAESEHSELQEVLVMNRKAADDQIMVFVFFILVFIVGAGLMAGVFMFFGSEYDIRKTDADILNYRIQKCISENPEITDNIQNLLDSCQLNKETIETNYQILIYLDETIIYGQENLLAECTLGEKNADYPKCSNSLVDVEGKNVKIITGANQKGARETVQ